MWCAGIIQQSFFKYIDLVRIRIHFKILSLHLLWTIEENHERPRTVQSVSRREATPGPSEYKAAMLAT
jgi:hypothetical protein